MKIHPRFHAGALAKEGLTSTLTGKPLLEVTKPPLMENTRAAGGPAVQTVTDPLVKHVEKLDKKEKSAEPQSVIDAWAKKFQLTERDMKDIAGVQHSQNMSWEDAFKFVKGEKYAENYGKFSSDVEFAKFMSGGNIPKSVTNAENRLARVNDPNWKPSPEAYTEAWLSDKDRRNMVSMMQNSGMGFDDALRNIKGKDNADLFLGSPDLKSFQGSMQNRKPDTDSGEAELRRKTTELKDRMDEQSKTISKVNVQLNDLLDKFTAFSGAASVAARAMRDFNAQFAP